MKYLQEWKVPVIAVLSAGLLTLILIDKRQIKYYLQYYVTRTADRYDFLDYGQLTRYRKLSDGFEAINQNLDRLNRKVDGMLDKTVRKEPLEFPPYFDREPDNKDISRRIYLLSVLINQLENTGKPANYRIRTFSQKLTDNRNSFNIYLPKDREIINRKFIIKNLGNQKIINPRIIVNDRKKWFDLDSMVQEIIQPGMTDEEKALSIWNFLNKNRYHYYPATEKAETHDVVKYLNAYGYGYCDDTSASLYLLAEKAGLKSRIWGLSGHVVCEIFYNSDWHMLDSDHQVFYLKKDNKTLAGVKDLADHPELIHRTPKNADPSIDKLRGLASLYASREDNYLGEYWMSTASGKHTMEYRLRPGESFEACWQGEGRYISNGRHFSKRPPEYGTGKFKYQPIFKEKIFFESILNEKNIKIIENKLTVSQSGKPGSFVIDFRTPYPITGAQIELTIKGENDSLTVSFSRDNKEWWEIGRFSGRLSPKTIVSKNISNYFPHGYDDPLYEYFLKFKLSGSRSLAIDQLTVLTNTQLSPRSLPELSGGKNKVSYLSDEPRNQAVLVEFQYSLGRKYHASPKPARPDKPQIDPVRILFSWKAPEKDTPEALEYNFQLSSRSDFLVPLTPKFDIITPEPQVIVDRKWLNKGLAYYWRTRSRYENEPWGQFSQVQRLAID